MMLLADQNVPVIPILLGIAVVVVFVAFALFLYRGYEWLARHFLARAYAGLQMRETPEAGDVILTYHTYHGLLVWITSTTHHVVMPPDDARVLLGRLLRFNLTWGLLTYGALFIPPFALGSYFAQRKSISSQEAANAFDASAISQPVSDITNPYASPAAAIDTNARPPSVLFWRIAGWFCGSFCVLFAVTTIVSLVRGEFEAVLGGVIVTAIFGVTAKSWIGKANA